MKFETIERMRERDRWREGTISFLEMHCDEKCRAIKHLCITYAKMGMHITFIPMLTTHTVNITPHGYAMAMVHYFFSGLSNNNPSNKLMRIYI